MSLSIPLYSVPVLVDNLNKITENVVVSTHENISNPSPMYVQTIILELLRQIGFSRFVLNYLFATLKLLFVEY